MHGHQASQVAQRLKISKSTIARLLKHWVIRGDTQNLRRSGKKNIVTKRAANTLSMVVKTSRRATLNDITAIVLNARLWQYIEELFGENCTFSDTPDVQYVRKSALEL